MEERLQKLISQAGIASRRHAEELITAGQVTVNGEIVTELGTKADPAKDHIKVQGKLINTKLETREMIYVLLNKPRGFLSSVSDPEGRRLVTDLVPESLGKLYPVGRLDYMTEGLLILTNDGDFTNFLTQSKNRVPKVYEVKVKGMPGDKQIESLRRGVTLDDGFRTAPAEIKLMGQTKTNAWYEITLTQGHNQQIRRMFDYVGHSVTKLKRVGIGGLRDERLKGGQFRFLAPLEVKRLTRPPRAAGAADKTKIKTEVNQNAAKKRERKPPANQSRNDERRQDATGKTGEQKQGRNRQAPKRSQNR